MAVDQYRRLTCISCPGTFVPRKTDHRACSKRCARIARQPPAELGRASCAHCAEMFDKAQPSAMFCGNRCKVAAWRASNPDRVSRHRLTAQQKTAAQPKPIRPPRVVLCKRCGKSGESVLCSVDCARQHAAALSRISAAAQHRRVARVVACAGCQAEFCPIYGAKFGRVPICSVCADHRAREARRQQRRKHGSTHRQRARRAGVAYEPVDLLAVLRRDDWTCQLCGVATPQDLRGTRDPRAPEVDHVIPLAAGGSHTAGNLQCACRACNGAKGADAGWRPPTRSEQRPRQAD